MPNEMIRQCLLLCTLECSADQLKLNIAAESPKRALGQLHSLMLMIGFSPPLASEICQKPRGSMPPGAKGGQKRGTSAVQPRTKPLAGSTKRVRRNRGKDNTEDDTPKGIKNVGHSFDRVIIEGHARAQLGNTYGPNVYYNAAHPSDESAEEKRWAALKKALGFRRMGFRLDTVNPAHADSCRWVLDTEGFERWRDPKLRDSHHGFFWIKGKPGAGKSTIMKYLYEHVQDQKFDFVVLAFFFNARGELLEKSVEGMWRSLLHQLLSMVPESREIVEIPDSYGNEQTWEVATLRELFRKAVLRLRDRKVICFIDALDECCDQNDARDMVAFLENVMQSTHRNKIFFYTCFSSRHYPRISVARCEEIIVEKEEAHESDIKKYISDKLILASSDLRYQLGIEIAKKSRGVFLWVVLVVEELLGAFNRGTTRSELFDLLSSLPSDLGDMLSHIIQAGASDPCFLPILQWVLVGLWRRSDRILICLFFGVRFASGQTDKLAWDPDEIDLEGMARFVNHSSKGLVEVTPPNKRWPDRSSDKPWSHDVHFIHESVRGHILAGGLAVVDANLRDVEAMSHAKIADLLQACIRLHDLRGVSPSTDSYSLLPAWTGKKFIGEYPTTEDTSDEHVLDHPLLNLAYSSALAHMEAAHEKGICQVASLQQFPWNRWYRYAIHGLPVHHDISEISLLQPLLDRECPQLALAWLDQHKAHLDNTNPIQPADSSSDETDDPRSISPIFLPINAGDLEMSLNLAVRNGYTQIVKKILDLGANIHALGTHALAEALLMSEGYDLLQLLLNRGLDINALTGNSSVLEELILKPYKAPGPLEWALDGFNSILEAVFSIAALIHHKTDVLRPVQFLLQRGTSAIGQDHPVLPAAAIASNFEPLTCLVQAGADPSAKDADGNTAFHYLVIGSRFAGDELEGVGNQFEGNQTIWSGEPGGRQRMDARQTRVAIQLLVDQEANINEPSGQNNKSPLTSAIFKRNPHLAQFLLDLGADTLHRSENHGTPLGIAFDNPERGMFWLLWHFGTARSIGLPNMNELQRKSSRM